MRSMRRASLLLLTPLLAVAVACGSDEGQPTPPADEISYELFPSTRQLTEADTALITAIEPEGRIVFSAEPPGLAGVTEGTIFLAGISPATPQGLLRFVTKVDRSNGFVLETTAAPLQTAFRRLHAKINRKVEPFKSTSTITDMSPMTIRPQFTAKIGAGDTYDIIVFDGDGDPSTKNDQVRVEATLAGGFVFGVEVDIDWGAVDKLPSVVTDCIKSVAKIATGEKPSCNPLDLLPEARATFSADPYLTFDAKASGAASLSFEKTIEVGTVSLPPFPIGPLVFTPNVDVFARIDGGASARFELGAHARAEVTSSVVVSSKSPATPTLNPPALKTLEATADKPVLDLHAHAKAAVGARLNVPLFGIVGPYAELSTFAKIDATPLDNPCFRVSLGVDTQLGVRITTPKLPGIGYLEIANASTGRIAIVTKEIASGSCDAPPDPPPPPGGGPAPKTLQSPPFTPWAKALPSDDIDPTAAASISSFGWPDLVPSIDGRYVLAGESTMAVHKIDADGNLTWRSRLGTPVRRNRVLRTVAATNGEMFVLLRPEDTAAFVLAKLGQSGAVDWTREYLAPPDCIPTVTGLFRDQGKGILVTGQCKPDLGFVARIAEDGSIVRARGISEAGARLVKPTVSTVTTEGEVVLVGEVARPEELEWTWVSRLDALDQPTASTSFQCPERLVAQPTAAIPAIDGGVTVVGNANGLGMVARVRKDNTLGFVKYPNVGGGVASSMTVTSIAELSTTGMIIAANTGSVSQSPTHWITLVGLDSGGSTLWSRRYVVPGSPNPITFPALRMTDDGGVFVTAISSTPDAQRSSLYAMKVFAKDGFLGEGQALTSETAVIADFTCATTTRPFAPSFGDFALTSRPSPVTRLP